MKRELVWLLIGRGNSIGVFQLFFLHYHISLILAYMSHSALHRSINRQRLVAHSTAMESIQAESEPIDEEEDVP